jgi:hypothetical protein
VFADAGHFPHHQDPERFVELLNAFIATTDPVKFDSKRWRRLLSEGREGAELDQAAKDAASNVVPIRGDAAEG